MPRTAAPPSKPSAPPVTGADGQGKVGPALKGTSLTADQIFDLLTKGDDSKKAPHKKPMASLSADDAKAVAAYVKMLKWQQFQMGCVRAVHTERSTHGSGGRPCVFGSGPQQMKGAAANRPQDCEAASQD